MSVEMSVFFFLLLALGRFFSPHPVRPWCSGRRREHRSSPGPPGLGQFLGAENQHRNS